MPFLDPDTSASSHAADRRSIPSLDGLRAISISLVLLAHASLLADFPSWLRPASHFALLGVRIFYVISGYLITTLLLREWDRKQQIDLRRFYLRRTLRIFPPYYVFLASVAIAGACGWLDLSGARWFPALTYTSNIFRPHSWFIGHSWTLSIEEQFYICWPLVLSTLGRKGALKVALLVLICSPILRVGSFLILHNPRAGEIIGFDSIAAGCTLALVAPMLASNELWNRISHSRAFLVVPLIGLVVHWIGAKGIRWDWAFDIALGQTIVALVIAITIAWSLGHSSGVVFSALNFKPVRWLGILSYSIYLWQEIFLWQASPLYLWTAVLLTLLAATMSFALIERPALSLRRKAEHRLGWRSVRDDRERIVDEAAETGMTIAAIPDSEPHSAR